MAFETRRASENRDPPDLGTFMASWSCAPLGERSHSMQTIAFAGKTYSLDDNGFLDPPEQWDTRFAEGMAESLGIEGGLSKKHWAVIHYLRRKLLEEKTLP